MIRTFSQNIGRYGNLEDDANWDALLSDVVEFLAAQLGKWETSVDVEELRRRAEKRTLGAIVRAVYEKEMQAHGKRQLFVKENHLYSFAPFILVEFPDSRFVFLVRDPRDVALSWKRSANHPGGVKKAMDVWLKDQEGFVKLDGFLADTGRVALIRYEDLIADPEQHLKRLSKHVGVEYSESMLAFHEDKNTRQNAERIRNWENLAKPVLAENTKKYLDGLSEEEIRYIETRCKDYMQYFGYTPEFAEPMNENAFREFEDALEPDQLIEHTPEEREIRERRIAALKRVIDRPLMKSSDLA